jgi:hypothetical protein
MMPSVMDERPDEIRGESISGDHLSEKAVFVKVDWTCKDRPTFQYLASVGIKRIAVS